MAVSFALASGAQAAFEPISCANASFCAQGGTADGSAAVLTTTSPTGPASGWKITKLPSSFQVSSVSCPTTRLCAAATANGQVFVSTNPLGGTSAWRQAWAGYGAAGSLGPAPQVACSPDGHCVAVDPVHNASAVTSNAASTAPWKPLAALSVERFNNSGDVSCAGGPVCVLANGYVFQINTDSATVSGPSNPLNSSTTSSSGVQRVSCVNASVCYAMGTAGGFQSMFLSSGDGGSSWSATPWPGTFGLLPALSCSSSSLCAIASDTLKATADPAGGPGSWGTAPNPFGMSRFVSCAPGLCVTGSEAGIAWSTNPVGGQWNRVDFGPTFKPAPVAPSPSQSPAGSQPSGAGGCPDYMLFDSRGSGTQINSYSPAGAALYDQLREQHNGQRVTRIWNPYPAVELIGGWRELLNFAGAAFKVAKIGAYHDSVADGKKWLRAHLASEIRSCPDTKLVLTGYSQGAQVTGDVWQRNLSDAQRKHVVRVALFGDPYFNPKDERDRGGFSEDRHGALGKRVSFRGDERVVSYCHLHDPICNWDNNPVNIARYKTAHHSDYGPDGTSAAKGI